MFEKLKSTQPLIASEIEESIRSNTFSASSLYCGNEYSSKMTAAIETAKALSCHEDGLKDCTCPSCVNFNNLTMQNVVIVSNRNYSTRIKAAVERFIQLRSDFSKQYLIETVRILLLSYHSCLYTDKNKALFTAAYNANDMLIEFSYHKEPYKINEAKKFTKNLLTTMKPLLDQDKKNLTNLSVDAVRNLQLWVGQTKIKDKAKIIIIEGIEKSNDSVRNSLLKILEEPGEGTYFILLSSNPGRIMKTILSRVRRYYFPPIQKSLQIEKIKSFQMEDSSVDTFEKFFLSCGGFKEAEYEDYLNQIVESFYDRSKELSLEEIWKFCILFDKTEQSDYILKILVEKIERAFLENKISATQARALVKIINEDSIGYKVFNISKKNFFESLYRKLLGVIGE
jgi:DNA polymerase-3 subunit gamma/tau